MAQAEMDPKFVLVLVPEPLPLTCACYPSGAPLLALKTGPVKTLQMDQRQKLVSCFHPLPSRNSSCDLRRATSLGMTTAVLSSLEFGLAPIDNRHIFPRRSIRRDRSTYSGLQG